MAKCEPISTSKCNEKIFVFILLKQQNEHFSARNEMSTFTIINIWNGYQPHSCVQTN